VKRPSFQFYPGDWRRDPALSICSLAARGLWIDLMCLAHESAEYGVLSINGNPMTDQQIARVVGESVATVAKLSHELESCGVFSRTEKGAIFSRRMVRDEQLRSIRAAGGEGGKKFGVLGAEHGKKGGRPRNVTGDKKPPLQPPPSSSSSSSFSEIPSEANASGGKPPKLTDPDEIIFGYGLPMLTTAGTTEKQARSFLGGLRKQHGDDALIAKLRDCAKAKPLQPLEWLAAALPPKSAGRHAGFDQKNYREGVSADGSFA